MGAEGERELAKGVCGRENLAVPGFLTGESKLLSLSCLTALGSREPGFPLRRGITEALAYLPLGLPFSFLSGPYMWRFWKYSGFVLTRNENRFEELQKPSFFFFWIVKQNSCFVASPAYHIWEAEPAAERLMKSNLTKPDCAFLSRSSAGSSP